MCNNEMKGNEVLQKSLCVSFWKIGGSSDVIPKGVQYAKEMKGNEAAKEFVY